MNKELEALKRIKQHCEHYYDALLGEMEEYQLIEQALKLNEPMKPNYGGKFPQCPVCKKLLHSIWQKHCDNCTQAIDWSNDKWERLSLGYGATT